MKYSRCVCVRVVIAVGLFWTPVTFHAGVSLGEEPALRGPAADIDGPQQVEFRRDVLPLLRRNCLACHSQSEAEGELVMETAESVLAGGDSGPAIIPGDADESLLFQLASRRTEPFMPPVDNDVGAKPLTPEQLGILKLWIDQGARASESGSAEAEHIVWKTVPERHAPIYALDMSSDGRLVAAGRGNEIVLYSVRGQREQQRLMDPNLTSTDGVPRGTAHLDIVQSLAFSPDGRLLASGGFRCVKIWQRPPITRASQFQLPEPPRVAVSSPDGNLLALCFRGLIELRDAQGRLTAELGVDGSDIVATDFLGADQLVMLTEAGEVQIRSAADLTVLDAWPVPESTGQVHALAVLQHGNVISVASTDGVVHIWRRSDGGEFLPQVERQIRVGEPGQLRQIVATGNDLLAVAASDGAIRFWHVLEGNPQGEIQAGGEPTSLAVSPDGQQLVALLGDGSGKLWNVKNRQLIKELPRDVASRASVAAATRLVGLGRERHRVAAADLDEAKKRKAEADQSLKSSQEELKKAEEDAPKKQETLGKAKQNTTQREEAVQKVEQSIVKFKKRIADIEASLGALKDGPGDAQRTALGKEREQQTTELQKSENELKTAKEELDKARSQQQKDEQAMETAQKAVGTARAAIERAERSVQQAADGQSKAEKEAESFAEKVKSSEAELAQVHQRAGGSLSHFVQAMFSSDGWRLCVQDKQGRLVVLVSTTGEHLDLLDGVKPGMMVGAGTGRVDLLDEQTVTSWQIDQPWALAKVLGDPTDDSTFVDRVTALAFSDDGTWLATGGGEPSRSGEVQIWEVSDWQRRALISDAHSDVVYDLGFSPQGDYLASCGSDRMVKLIDITEAQPMRSFEGHTGHVLGVAWRADGRTLATAGADRVVKVWDAKNGTQRKSLGGFQKEITGIRFLGLEDRFVFAVGDGQVMSRNSNGDGRPAFPGYSDYVHRISSSLDGSLVAAAGQDGVVRLWDAQGKKLAEFGK